MSPLVPIHYQIKQAIKSWIIDREFRIGDKIPSENTLAQKFHVNRFTVRQAISQLIQEGFLTSKRGQGTYVKNNKSLIDSYSVELSGFVNELFYQVSKSKTKSVRITKIAAPRFIKEKLELDDGNEVIVQIRRVRFLDGKPFALTINYLPLDIGKKLSKGLLYEKPLLEILEENFGIHFTEAFEVIQAAFADQEVAKQLKIASGSPILFVERTMYTKNRKPVEVVRSSYPGEMYKYIVRLKNLEKEKGHMWIHQSE